MRQADRDAPRQSLRMVAAASRRYWVGATMASAFVAYLGIGNAIEKGGAGYVILGLIGGGVCFISARTAVRRSVEFSVSEAGFVLGAAKRVVPWDEVAEIHLGVHGDEHHLIKKLSAGGKPRPRRLISTNATNPSEIDVGLDHLSQNWQELVDSVESASGKPVKTVREGAFRRRTR
jgi:hypothetical protein